MEELSDWPNHIQDIEIGTGRPIFQLSLQFRLPSTPFTKYLDGPRGSRCTTKFRYEQTLHGPSLKPYRAVNLNPPWSNGRQTQSSISTSNQKNRDIGKAQRRVPKLLMKCPAVIGTSGTLKNSTEIGNHILEKLTTINV